MAIPCVLTDKEQTNLKAKVLVDFMTALRANKPIDIKNYLSQFYNDRIAGDQSIERATTFVQLIPKKLDELTNLYPELKPYIEKNIGLSNLFNLAQQFDQDLDNVSSYLGTAVGDVTKRDIVVKDTAASVQNTGYSDKPLSPPKRNKRLKPDHVNATTGQEEGATEEARVRYSFLRKILRILSAPKSQGDSRNLDIVPGGLMLTLMHSNKIEGAKGDTVFVVTDRNGNALRFNKDLQPIGQPAERVDISTSTRKSPYFKKDLAKFSGINKLIARGSKNSSSEAYRIAAGPLANTGSYTSSDVVGVTSEGNRVGRVAPDVNEIKKAIAAGATIITDAKEDRNRDYNIGEREVAKLLTSNGYTEVSPGKWKSSTAVPEEGSIMYYDKRRIVKKGDRYYALDSKGDSSIQDDKVSQEAIRREFQADQYIRANPDAKIMNVITGGSLGLLDYDLSRPPVKLSEYKGSFYLWTPKKSALDPENKPGEDNKSPYFRDPNIDERILVQEPNLHPDLIEKLISTIVDPIYNEHDNELMPPSWKAHYVKQYISTRGNFVLNPTRQGLNVVVNGKILDLSNPVTSKGILRDYFTKPEGFENRFKRPKLNINEDFLGSNTGFDDYELEPIRPRKSENTALQKEINEVYKQISAAKLTDPDTEAVLREKLARLKLQDRDESNLPEEVVPKAYKFKSVPITDYKGWLYQRLELNYKLNLDGTLSALNPYFDYQITPDELNKITEKPIAPDPTYSPVSSQDNLTDQGKEAPKLSPSQQAYIDELKKKQKPGLRKTTEAKEAEVQATETQNVKAKEWYEKESGLVTHIPFHEMFQIMNSDRVAEFFSSGINLYKGATYSDLYHESWHAFSQLFLTLPEKEALYNEVKKRSGSFTDHLGNKVKFSDPDTTPKQIEEYLAEDFRKYMLSDGKLVMDQTPKRNTIFRRILNFLKSIFGGSSIQQVVADERSVNTVNELYNRLRTGNIPSSFSADNAMFNVLAKGVKAIGEDPVQELDPSTSQMAVGILNIQFSDFLDTLNIGNTGEYYTMRYLTTPQGRAEAYEFTLKGIKDRYDELFKEYAQKEYPATEQGEQIKLQDEKDINTLSWMIRHFGDPTNFAAKTGLVAYHLERSEIAQLPDETEEGATYQGWGKSGNEISAYKGARPEVRTLVKSLHKVDAEGNRVPGPLGFGELVDMIPVWNNLEVTLRGSANREEMEARIRDRASKSTPAMKAVLNELSTKLGPSTSIEDANWNMWSSFFHAFNRFQNKQIAQIATQNEDGTIESKIGQAYGEAQSAKRAWYNTFNSGSSRSRPDGTSFIIMDPRQGASLNIAGLIGDSKSRKMGAYPDVSAATNNLFQFFNDMGVELDDVQGIHDELDKDPEYRRIGKYMWLRLAEMQRQDIKIQNLNDLFNKDILVKTDRHPDGEKKNEAKNYSKLAELQVKYSDRYSNLSVTIPGEDKTIYESTLNNSMSATLRGLNNSTSYSEMINNNPYMGLLNRERNHFAKESWYLESIFDFTNPLTKDTGPVRIVDGSPMKLKLENMAGLVFIGKDGANQGIASSKAGMIDKFLMDLSFYTQTGRGENLRAAEKSSSPMMTPAKIFTPYNANNRNVFIEPKWFVDDGQWDVIYKSIFRYIKAEHSRVQEFRNAPKDSELRDAPQYFKNGQQFVMFEDYLSDDTKKELYNVPAGTLDQYLKTDKGRALEGDIRRTIRESFQDMFDDTQKLYDKAPFIAPNLLKQVAKDSKNAIMQDRNNEKLVRQAILRAYTVNSWMHNFESATVFIYGDPAMYKSAAEFHKRLSAYSSTGDIFEIGPTSMAYLNKIRDPGTPEFTVNPRTAVMNDPLIVSALYSHIHASLEAEARKRFTEARDKGAITATDKELEQMIQQRADLEAESYGKVVTKDGKHTIEPKVEIGNAQGWISFAKYRLLRIASKKWSPEQEELYQKMREGHQINIGEATRMFPIDKYQYAGLLQTFKGMPMNAIHKYSLFPLIPNVIDSAPVLKKLAAKMDREDITYATLKSASKAVTLTNKGEWDKWNDDWDQPGKLFTPNVIYLEFLKDQQNLHDEFEKSVRISTQTRKIITTGLYEGGVPTDFLPSKSLDERRDKWAQLLTEQQREKASPKYILNRTFENAVAEKTEAEKRRLLKEIGWGKDEYGKVTEKLAQLVKNELSREDVGDHESNYIDLKSISSGELKHDLSYSLSTAPIEKALASLVNKRLVYQRTKGNSMVQVSDLGWEEGPYGPLRGYSEDPKTGLTLPATAKIALQGDFLNLLHDTHNDGKTIGVFTKDEKGKVISTDEKASLKRLNDMINDEKWLSQGDRKAMITFMGPRIPTQELNSMEFMQVQEFLPQAMSNSIIVHPDITAKAGSDFDVDKLPSMFPNIQYRDGKATLFRKYDTKDARKLYEELQRYKEEADQEAKEGEGNLFRPYAVKMEAYDKLLQSMFGSIAENLESEMDKVVRDTSPLPSFEDFFEELNGAKAAENNLLKSMIDILQQPFNYANLVRPNATFSLHPIADDLRKWSAERGVDYNPAKRLNSTGKEISWSRLMEPRYNLHVHQTNTVALQTLAISATDNTANVLLNRVGAHLNAEYYDRSESAKRKETGKPTGVLKQLRMEFKLPNGKKAYNTVKYDTKDGKGSKEVISLSHVLDSSELEKISEIISQMINGELEVAKDDWAYYIQANKEVVPTLHFMIQAGVPPAMAIYFASQSMVQQYIDEIRAARSIFSTAIGKAPSNPNFYRVKAMGEMLMNPKYGFNLPLFRDNPRTADSIEMIHNLTRQLTAAHPEIFTEEGMRERLKLPDSKITDQVREADKAALLHYFEVEDMGKALSSIKFAINFDTKRQADVFMATNKQAQVAGLENKDMFPDKIIKDLLGIEPGTKGSPISSLYSVLDFMKDFLKPLFVVRADRKINDFLLARMQDYNDNQDIKRIFPDVQKAAASFNNDLMSYVFQNSIRKFAITAKTEYRGFNMAPESSATPVKVVPHLKFGAYGDRDTSTLYYDMNQLLKDADSKEYLKASYETRGLAKIEKSNTFSTKMEFYNFVFEREYLRSTTTLKSIQDNSIFTSMRQDNMKVTPQKTMTNEAYERKITHLTYEQYIRDRALENIGNAEKLFHGSKSYADQVIDIRNNNLREPIAGYSLLNILDVSEAASRRSDLRNLQLRRSDLGRDEINVYHKELEDLANPAIEKVSDEAENLRISTLFQKFPMVAFLQSGLTTTGPFSMIRLIPNTGYIMHMEQAVGDFMKKLNPAVLSSFYTKWIANNSTGSRSRYKDYTQAYQHEGRRTLVPAKVPVYETGLGHLVYTGSEIKDAKDARQLTETLPDTVFVFNDRTSVEKALPAKGDDAHFNSSLVGSQLTVGIPTRVTYTEQPNLAGKRNVMTDDTLEDNKRAIDEAIEQLKQWTDDGKQLAFNSNGYGQGMIGKMNDGVTDMPRALGKNAKPGLRTFLYLSQKLYENFGYVNKNYEIAEAPSGETPPAEVLKQGQYISDDEVRKRMLDCLGL